MNNTQIADAFEQVADLLEFQGANPFRLRAYRNSSRTIRGLAESISAMIDEGQSLTDIDGIGKDLAAKCVTLVETGKLPMLEELREKVPAGVLALLRIPGLGPKKAAVLFNELKIESLEQLKQACEEERVRELKGFGAKTEKLILDGMKFAETAGDRIYWARADEIAQELRDHLNECESVEQLELAGSYRRGKETVGDLDVLVVSTDAETVMNHFGEFSRLNEVMMRGDTKMAIRLGSGLQVDLRVVPAESFGAALQYFTGSKEHNVIVRGKARKLGLKVNEYGVYRVDDGEYVAGATEQEVYATLDMPLFPPELREARREFEWADSDNLPELVELNDIRGDLHMHTTATDGKATIEEMVEAAISRGLKYIAITDHSKRVSMAFGLDEEKLLQQWEEVDRVNAACGKSFTVLKGIECDILEKGGMDLSDEVLSQADWVLGSVHYGQNQSEEKITDRIVGALENPHVTAIAHPTGRLLNKREAYAVNMDRVFAAAKEQGKLLELNASPARLDLNDTFCAAAKTHGIPIVINTDAHSIRGLDVLRYGVLQARRAGLSKADVANTKTWLQLKKLIGKS